MFKLIKRVSVFAFAIALLLSAAIPAYAGILPNYKAYEYSDAYRSSNYYTQLLEARSKLTGDQRYDVILVALSQLGYHEGDSEEDMDGWNLNGSDNFVEYNRLFCKLDGKWGYAWCAAFVSWCQFQANVPKEIDCSEVSCPRMINDILKPQGLYKSPKEYTPLIGDLIYFKSAGSNAVSTHVGLVLGIKDGYVYTIEGNAGQKVGRHKYSLTDPYIVGYGALNYETKPNTDYSVFELTNSDMAAGEYIVTANSLNVRNGIGTSFPVIGTVNKGEKVNVVESTDGWAKISYNGTEGWVSESYLRNASYNLCTVFFKTGGGDFVYTQKRMSIGEEYTIPSEIPTLKGYIFIGWATEYRGQVKYNAGDKHKASEDLTLYAVWETQKMNVTFLDYDGTVLATAQCDYGTKVKLPEGLDPKRDPDGETVYEFDGWDPILSYYLTEDATYKATYTSRPMTDEEKAAYESANATEPPPTEPSAPATSEPKKEPVGGCNSGSALAIAAILPFMLLIKKKKH